MLNGNSTSDRQTERDRQIDRWIDREKDVDEPGVISIIFLRVADIFVAVHS